MDITEFLTARWGEEEALARATTPVPIEGQWCATRDKHADADAKLRLVSGRDPYKGEDWNEYESGEYNGAPIIAFSAEWQDEAEANLRYIAYHDPAHVLDDLTVKRYLLNEYKLAATFDVDAAAKSALNASDEEAQLLQLAEVAAKEAGKNVMLGVVKALASAYALHPDYDPAWSLWPHVRALAEKAKG